MKCFPFSIFALAPFPGVDLRSSSPLSTGPLDLDDVDGGIAELGCDLDVAVSKAVCPRGEVSISLSRLADIQPGQLVSQSAYLATAVEALAFSREHREDPEALVEGIRNRFGDLPLQLPNSDSREDPTDAAHQSVLDSLLAKVAIPGEEAPPPLAGQVESLLRRCLSAIYSDRSFRRLESTLLGIDLLLRKGPIHKKTQCSLTLFPVDRRNLEEVLREIVKNSSAQAPSLVLVDLTFDSNFSSIDDLETLANFSEAIHVPTIASLAPEFFHLKSWGELENLGYLSHELDSQPYAVFRALSNKSSVNWLTLALPEVSVRAPFTSGDEAMEPVPFNEQRGGRISPVWAFGALAVQSQMASGWASGFTLNGSCRIEGANISGPSQERTPMITRFPRDRLRQFQEIGMAPLCSYGGQNIVYVDRAPTLSGGSLGMQLFVSRIIDYLHRQRKQLIEEGGAGDADELVRRLSEDFLRHWQETGQPQPDDFMISLAPADRSGNTILSLRVTPPNEIVPNPVPIEFEF